MQLEPSQRQHGKLVRETPAVGKHPRGAEVLRAKREGDGPDRVPNGDAPRQRARIFLPRREGEGKGGERDWGVVRTGGPLTLTAVLFAIVRAHPAAVMPAVSLDTP